MSEQPPPYPSSDWTPPGATQPPAAPVPQPPYGTPPPPPQGYGYPPPPVPPTQPSKTMAIIALILAIIPCGISWIAAIVLAVIVLVKAKKGAARGRGLAIAALVISVLWLVVGIVVVAVAISEEVKKDNAREAGAGTISVVDLKVGDCLVDSVLGKTLVDVEITPCAKTHRGEVYAVFSLAEGSDPTQDAIDELSGEGCAARFESYVGVRYGRSTLDFTYVSPAKRSMALNDEAVCIVALKDEAETVGSLKDSKR